MLDAESNQIQVFDKGFRALAKELWIPTAIFFVLAFLAWILLSRTVVGRHLYALGGNEDAARLSGIRTDLMKWLAYCLGAMTSALAGVLYIGDQSTADPQVLGVGYELNAIAAAVVGGCSLRGGIGTIPGTMLGCFFLRVVMDGINKVIKVSADVYEGLIVGMVVVVAVAVNQIGQSGGRSRQFFPGALGAVTVLNLSLLAGVVAFLIGGANSGMIVGACAFVALGVTKFSQDRSAKKVA
jgi:ribose/xylose/arabinose/galactoside ABC-type transport system permease subunit